MKNGIGLLLLLCMLSGFSQKKTITFRPPKTIDSLTFGNPFKKFIGEWTLKDDQWTQNWGNGTETILIPRHHTITTVINTANSLFSIVDGPEPNGHIFWSYNPVTKRIHHLSSFGALRSGVGHGSINKNGDITLKIRFEGEPEDTYRIYKYTWATDEAYHMKSVQYDAKDKPTGLFYEGIFIRPPKVERQSLRAQIELTLAVLDNTDISVEEQLKVYADDIVHMAPNSPLHIGKEALGSFLKAQRKYGEAHMKHEILEIEQQGNIVLMRGQVTGTYYPKDHKPPVDFKTKNLFIFSVVNNTLHIKKVIYNASPLN